MREKASKKALELHREMFKRRLLELSWRRGKSLRETIERANTTRDEKEEEEQRTS